MEQNPLFLCRICLKVGAIHPLFEVGETCLLNKLCMCLNEKLEDVDGYPRYICEECKENLDLICSFINKFKSTNIMLQNDLHLQKSDFETENLNCLSEEEDLTNIEVEYYVGYEVDNDHISDVSYHEYEESLLNRKKPMKSKSLTKNSKGTIKKPNTAAIKIIKSSCMPQRKPKNNELARQYAETPAQIHCFPPASNIMSENSSLHAALDSNKTRKRLVPSPINIKQETVQPVQAQDKNMYENRGNAPGKDIVNSDVLTTHTHKEPGKEYGEQQCELNRVAKTNTDILMATLNNLTSKLSSLESKVDNYAANNSKNQIIVTLNQEQIMQKLSEITAQFDEFIKRSSTVNLSRTEDKGIKNIHNEESLNAFEELLKDKQQLEKMKNIYSVVCGKGKGRAINNAYALCDAMFDRKFLKQCSWAGGSRGETAKICFKSYRRVIDFFFYLIHTSDNQFTIMECETFLKNILKNSTKRCESQHLRRSAQKIRQKKKELKPEENGSPELENEQIEEQEYYVINNIPEAAFEISSD